MVQLLRALAAVAKDPGSVHSTHIVTFSNSSSTDNGSPLLACTGNGRKWYTRHTRKKTHPHKPL